MVLLVPMALPEQKGVQMQILMAPLEAALVAAS
jgi:hypothetical protein